MAEGVANKVEVVQPEIRHESYVQTYSNALDICMQGLVSPSTLGIDVKKLDNAEAQREKEKVTLYTRNQIVTKLQQALPQLVRACVWAWRTSQGMMPTDFDVDVEFGEYANPSFESMVETVGKARVQGIMSVEACVEEPLRRFPRRRLEGRRGRATEVRAGHGRSGRADRRHRLGRRAGRFGPCGGVAACRRR